LARLEGGGNAAGQANRPDAVSIPVDDDAQWREHDVVVEQRDRDLAADLRHEQRLV
jgi:hypothetical protein